MAQKFGGKAFDQPSIILALDWFDERIYRGIVRYSTEARWHLSPYLMSDRFIPYGWPADGAITCYGKTLSDFIATLGMPQVDISFEELPRRVPRVQVSNDEIGTLAAEHFIERGFHDFAFFSWPQVPVNQMRKDAFFNELKLRGVEESHLFEIHQSEDEILGNWHQHQAALFDQIRQLPRPLAVYAGQDNLAATILEVCVRNGVHVPEEIAVLGTDNITLLCNGMMVSLSSIDTQLEGLGYEAAKRLDELMRGEIRYSAPPVYISPKEIVCRQSTDILAVEHPAVVRGLKFIKDHFHEAITLEDVAEATSMSKRGLEKAFLKHLERTPAEALRRFRLDAAKAMLTEGTEKIEAIAQNCGYSNSSNLSFAFRKDTGMSPRAYRKKFRA